ncbi:hypothetical protein EST38_g7659 [Candolleomyces aberdarensis]|uniref:Uncharacterized protein n=1 Tax=Candolleomyces aberdarensis TaxID=2316362 RepID=A0A4Q2DGJ3_9AGAR|nr:hypothetical protein EST38_g7659 [Candolleomyces aberdarensis]
MQLLANFGFQLDPGKSATVQFTQLTCSEDTDSSKEYQAHYLHQYLKVLVDARSPKWRSCHCSPKRTPAAQREIKDVTTTKSSKQGGTKLKVALAPSGSLEGNFTSENSKASERVRFTSGIMQKEWLGEYTWGFNVDDEKEQLMGLELSDDKLPNLSLAYFPDARQPSESDIPEELTVEISAFWSLAPQRPNSWLSISNLISLGQRLPEYSNFVHSVRVDLPADMDHDGHFVGKQDIVNGGGIPERREIITKSGSILVSTGIQLTGNQHPEEIPRWLPKQKIDEQ